MKSITLIAGMAVLGGILGAGYTEYSEYQTTQTNARKHVLEVGKAYIRDQEQVLESTSAATKQCALEQYFVEFPPVMTSLVRDLIVADYQLVRKYGVNAEQHVDELTDLRNKVSNKYYDDVDTELETLSPEAERRILKMMTDFRIERTKVTRCINAKAYANLVQVGVIR